MSWMLFPANPALSAVALFLIALPFLYAARSPVHEALAALARAVAGVLRLGSRWLGSAATELRARNKTVLLAHAREETKATIEREFERVMVLVQRDLNGYPALQRKLLDEITRVEEDYQKCGEVPPPPPSWTKAIEVIAKIKDGGDGLVQKILLDISTSIEGVYAKLTAEYRRSYEQRHKILKGFMPFWRSLEQTLARVDRNITGLQDSAAKIDSQMEKYREIDAGTETIEHTLTNSSFTQFVIAATVLVIGMLGAFVNFFLVQEPMGAMVGGGKYVGFGLDASHVAAMVIIMVEASMGLFLMETLGITHLFPGVQNLPDRMRRRLMWVAFTFLLTLAGVEVALAVLRDQIVAAGLAFKAGLGSQPATSAVIDMGWVGNIPGAGQMILGFVLPFALAFIAIPLEYFIYSARTVLGALLVALLRTAAFVLRLGANVTRQIVTILVKFYDAIIFLPLVIERLIRARNGAAHSEPAANVPPAKRAMFGHRL